MSLASPAAPGSAVPPVDRVAHRRLVEALLRAGEPGGGRSYALLWQCAAAEQQRVGRASRDAERSLELLVTEILALSHTAPWFDTRPELTAAAIEETIAYWTGTTQVPSRDAHQTWHQCWESRVLVTQVVPARGTLDMATLVAAEQRLRSDWADRWREWADRWADPSERADRQAAPERPERSGWPTPQPAD